MVNVSPVKLSDGDGVELDRGRFSFFFEPNSFDRENRDAMVSVEGQTDALWLALSRRYRFYQLPRAMTRWE